MGEKMYIPTPNPAYCANYDECSEKCKNCDNKSVDITTVTILQECAAFYDVFKGLEKRLENSGIAEAPPEHENPILLQVPYIVNGAFACELALIYILIENQVSFDISRKGHNLEYLFSQLPQTEKEALESILKQAGNIDRESLEKNIHIFANSFQEWRYLFSNTEQGLEYTSFFSIFVNELCKYVLNPDD